MFNRVSLVCGSKTEHVPRSKMEPYLNAKGLRGTTYEVEYRASEQAFHRFAKALRSGTGVIKPGDEYDIMMLSREFNCHLFDDQLNQQNLPVNSPGEDLLNEISEQVRMIKTDMMKQERNLSDFRRELREFGAFEERIKALEEQVYGAEGFCNGTMVLESELSRSRVNSRKMRHKRTSKTIAWNSDPLTGIISYLRKVHGADSVIATERDKEVNEKYWAKHVLTIADPKTAYTSDDEEGGWVCLDFGARRVTPTHFALRTVNFDRAQGHMVSWVMEGSITEGEWETLYQVENTDELCGPSKIVNFKCEKADFECRWIRLRMVGLTVNRTGYLNCAGIEVFGVLTEVQNG